MVFSDDGERLRDLYGRPLRNAVIEDLPRRDHIRKDLHRLFDGRRRVEAVAEVQIEVIELHVLQRLIELFDDVLARKPPIVCAAPHREEYLRRDDELVSAVFFERLAQKTLRRAARIGVRAVEKIHARVECGVYRFERDLLRVRSRKIGHPASERDLAHLQTPFPQIAIVHSFSLCSEFQFYYSGFAGICKSGLKEFARGWA